MILYFINVSETFPGTIWEGPRIEEEILHFPFVVSSGVPLGCRSEAYLDIPTEEKWISSKENPSCIK